MLARGRIVAGIHHQPVQRAAAEGVHAFMGAFHAVFQQDIVAILFDQGGNQVIHETRVYEGRVRRHPYDDVGVQLFGRAGIAAQHIIFGPAHHDDVVGVAPFHDGFVGRIDGGGDGNVFQQPAFLQPVHDMPQQRLAGDGPQHLARQSGGAHAGLDHRHDADILAGKTGHAASPL